MPKKKPLVGKPFEAGPMPNRAPKDLAMAKKETAAAKRKKR